MTAVLREEEIFHRKLIFGPHKPQTRNIVIGPNFIYFIIPATSWLMPV